jgi:hypothetical protein
MQITEIIGYANSIIGDSSTDRLSQAERYDAATEATAWLLEELGNEHMVDRVTIEYAPSVLWYQMDDIAPYMMGSGELRLSSKKEGVDFTRVDGRELASMPENRFAYAIERYDDKAFLGVVIPKSEQGIIRDLVRFEQGDSLTYTGTNASNITPSTDHVRFDMTATGVSATGLSTITDPINLEPKTPDDVYILDVEIPDIEDITSISLSFGDDLATDYVLITTTQDFVVGNNTVVFKHRDRSVVGTPDLSSVTRWRVLINHQTSKPAVEGFKFSDLRSATIMPMEFKYLFYRVGKNTSGADITEFGADTDVPFFSERYPQYKFAVGHKAASVLFRFLQLWEESRQEAREADVALARFRKNFPSERDAVSSTFKPAGVNLRRNRIIRRR